MAFLGFFIYIVSCHPQRQFYFFLSSWMIFNHFCSLIIVAITSSIILNKGGKSRILAFLILGKILYLFNIVHDIDCRFAI